ncbi:MAG: hypothetical protein JXQ90_15560 [Cyclobacteriaceae bacterium]
MMSRENILLTGAWMVMSLGIIHLVAHFALPANTQEGTELMNKMQTFEIQLFGMHNLLKFHQGFSIMMGFLLIVFGISIHMTKTVWLECKYKLAVLVVLMIMAMVITFVYFHLLAYGILGCELFCVVLTYFIPAPERSQPRLNKSP